MFGLVKQEEFNKQMQEMGFNETQVTQIQEVMKIHHENMAHLLSTFQKDNVERGEKHSEGLKVLDGKVESMRNQYVTPDELDTIISFIESKSVKLVENNGVQLSLESLNFDKEMTAHEQIQAYKNLEKQFNRDVGTTKSKILVSVKKYLGMKGNAKNSSFKSKDVDRAIQYIRDLKIKDVS